MKTLKTEHYEVLQRMIERMRVKYPQAELDLHTLSCSLWAFAQPEIVILGEVS